MNRKLYVGNLPFVTTEHDLRELFGSVGTVEEAKVMTDRETGRARGFAFVTMATESDTLAAIKEFNGTTYGGRSLVVNEARPIERRESGGRDSRDRSRSYSR